jgi:hypothetical protein
MEEQQSYEDKLDDLTKDLDELALVIKAIEDKVKNLTK